MSAFSEIYIYKPGLKERTFSPTGQHDLLLFHIQVKQNLLVLKKKKEDDWGLVRRRGRPGWGDSPWGDRSGGGMQSCVDMQLTPECLCVSMCVCMHASVCACMQSAKGDGMWVARKVMVRDLQRNL